jgi:hypothetical protein
MESLRADYSACSFFVQMHGAHLLGFHELAAAIGISKQNTRKHVRKPDFPPPMARLACGPVWAEKDVAGYLEQRRQR